MKELRIVFMGTPEFAVASLKELVEQKINVVCVITAPDKKKGRGKKLGTSPVKDYAQSKGLKILQPTNLKNPDFRKELKTLNANLQIVVAFRMLPEAVWNMAKLGTFNLHASLLPQYRGAAPINWAIINGESETGVTTFFLKHEIDTGNIILQEKEPIHPDDNVSSLYERLMTKGANLVLRTVRVIEKKDYELSPQKESTELKEAPKIFKEMCQINWDQPATEINNFIRGLSPYPCAWTILNTKTIKVYLSKVSEHQSRTAEVVTDNKTYLRFGCSTGSIDILELQMEGKKRMVTREFLKGYRI